MCEMLVFQFTDILFNLASSYFREAGTMYCSMKNGIGKWSIGIYAVLICA